MGSMGPKISAERPGSPDREEMTMNTRQTDTSGSVQPIVGPRCACCREQAGHTLGDCPAGQDTNAQTQALLRCRSLLREASTMLDQGFISATMSDIEDRINAELRWPNDPDQATASEKLP